MAPIEMVKNLPAMPETRVGSPSQEDPLEKGMDTHSSILAWMILSSGSLIHSSALLVLFCFGHATWLAGS